MIHASGIHAIRSGLPLQVPRREIASVTGGLGCRASPVFPRLLLPFLVFSWPYHLAGVRPSFAFFPEQLFPIPAPI